MTDGIAPQRSATYEPSARAERVRGVATPTPRARASSLPISLWFGSEFGRLALASSPFGRGNVGREPGEVRGARCSQAQRNSTTKDPHPNPLPRGEGARTKEDPHHNRLPKGRGPAIKFARRISQRPIRVYARLGTPEIWVAMRLAPGGSYVALRCAFPGAIYFPLDPFLFLGDESSAPVVSCTTSLTRLTRVASASSTVIIAPPWTSVSPFSGIRPRAVTI